MDGVLGYTGAIANLLALLIASMIHLWLRLISALTFVCILPIALIPALPYDDHDLSEFFTAAIDCPLPCFLGVRPGITQAAEALELLRQHEWISDVNMNASGRGYGDIRWNWSGAQSSLIDTARPVRMTFYWDREDPTPARPEDALIETISFYTHVRIYNAQTWYGDPDAGSVTVSVDDLISYMAAYFGQASMLHVSAALSCPLNLMTYWEARAKITMSIGYISRHQVPLSALMDTC
jgi:hypothetical protein